MPAKPVQISIDRDLLERIDNDPETQARGRSAFIRRAAEGYLAAKHRRQLDAQIAAAYGGESDALLSEAATMIDSQAWPAD